MTDDLPDPLPRSSRPAPASGKSRSPLPRWTVPVVAVLVSTAAVVVLMVLWRWIDGLSLADVEKKATAQLDAVKVAASIAVGGGGLFALYLAARRQRTQELELEVRHAELAQRDQVQAHAEQVAETNRLHAERAADDARVHAETQRVTELYAKSVEQLGSDKAPVRLGGLYALERLAQDNPHQRPTVINVLCAYLRMPFTLPGEPPADDADEAERTRYDERVQEREVRLTAQRILATHLRFGSGDPDRSAGTFWPDTDLDLTGATLINVDLSDCRLRHATFNGASFVEGAALDRASFTGTAWFSGASFIRGGTFVGAKFAGRAYFNRASFAKSASFGGASFAAEAQFAAASFADGGWFDGASFDGGARFTGASFAKDGTFGGTSFAAEAFFDGASFARGALFDGASFAQGALFAGASFAGGSRFEGAVTGHRALSFASWPAEWWPADEYGPIGGRAGTWHRIVHVKAVFSDGRRDESTSSA